MKITASRKDDILREKQEYDAQMEAYENASKQAWTNYQDAVDATFQPSIDAIKAALGADADTLTITMEEHFGHNVKVSITNSPSYSPRREENASLTWRWEAYLTRDGEVKKESSSWSGLDATTSEQIEDLKQCVRQLEVINNLDWSSLLDLTLPEYENFESGVSRPKSRDFDSELKEAEIEECIGQPILVKCSRYYEPRYYNGEVYLQFIKASGSQYTVNEIPALAVEQFLNGQLTEYYDSANIHSLEDLVNKYNNPIRVKKDRVFNGIVYPLETVEF